MYVWYPPRTKIWSKPSKKGRSVKIYITVSMNSPYVCRELKDRREDILLFANFFLDQANREMDKQLTGFDDKASRALLEYPWPGNLRQMKNMVRRATLLAQGKFITINELNELKEPRTGHHRYPSPQ